MDNPLLRKLEWYVRLSMDDKAALEVLVHTGVQSIGAGEDVVREGDRPTFVYLILRGWACRYKVLEDGRRQIIAFLLPGDVCDHNVFVLREMDHSIGALTPLRYARLPGQMMERLIQTRPRIAQALWWETLVNAAIQREWTVNLGQRSAIERVSHLICELFVRTRMAGLVEGSSFEFPVTQADLAEATGMTSVHVNRVLQELRSRKLIRFRSKRLNILDLPALYRLAMFNDTYLHLHHEGAHLDSSEPDPLADQRPSERAAE